MKEHKISFILIQIDEAHSTKWPLGLPHTPTPQASIEERFQRAREFVEKDNVPFTVLVDTWENSFDKLFRAWPDKYILVDKEMKLLAKSEYGKYSDALIDKDCYDLILEMIK